MTSTPIAYDIQFNRNPETKLIDKMFILTFGLEALNNEDRANIESEGSLEGADLLLTFAQKYYFSLKNIPKDICQFITAHGELLLAECRDEELVFYEIKIATPA